MKTLQLLIGVLFTLSYLSPLRADEAAGLVERLRQTQAVNLDEIIAAQFGQAEHASGFSVGDPYSAPALAIVERWRLDPAGKTEVCALRFTDRERAAYVLRGFESAAKAAANGYTVTHQGRCGSCSGLHDLAVYLSTPDLTTPARQCARRFGMTGKKGCFEETVGLSPQCAESWAYNARHTKEQCLGVCARDYGLLNLLFRRYPGSNVNASGQLRPCLQCDEDESGPGFKYSAGRTRRNSGIESDIARPDAEFYPLDHSVYFH